MLKTCNMSRALAKCFRSPSVLLVTSIILLSFTIHWILIKQPLRCSHFQIKYAKPLATLVDNEEKVTEIFNAITRTVPSVYFTNISTTTSAKNSRGIILDLKKQYCVGDSLTVQVTMFDYVGKRKTYGGDFLRARIFSPKVEAGASGRIEDLNNGLYNVHFALFWEGNVKISILLMHPSEGVAALWRARNSGYKNIIFYGQYEYRSKKVQSECGFELDSDEEKCEYGAKEDKDFFYCIKPDNVSCESLISVTSKERSHTYLNTLEKTLFLRSNIGVEIPQTTESVDVMSCNRNGEVKPKCSTGMFQPFPSGYFLNNVWYPVFCNLSTYDPQSHISKCLSGKKIYIMGDSTLLQWTHYIASIMNSLKFFDLHASGSFNTLLLLDTDKNVYIHWKKHGHPLLIAYAFTVKDYSTVNQEIDRLEGGPQTVFVFSLGHHFRPFPITLFINRLLNTRKAIERLFLRSPDTKVIIRTENTREQSVAMDRFSDFYGYIQYQLTKDIFQGLNVGIIDAWDMSIASGAFELHPSASTVKNQINMFLKYIC